MSNWKIIHSDRRPLLYHKDYLGKGYGRISYYNDKYVWFPVITSFKEGPYGIMESGLADSFKEAADILDDYFEDIGEYE